MKKLLLVLIIQDAKKNPTNGKTYELDGESTFTWKELIETISNASGKKKWKRIGRWATKLIPRIMNTKKMKMGCAQHFCFN